MNEEYYTRKYSFENFRLCKDLDTQGKYGIPIINPVELSEIPQFIGFNFARTEKRENIGLHFFCSGNSYRGIESVGIDWDKVHEVSGRTYEVKDFLKNKGFKWNGTRKSWTK